MFSPHPPALAARAPPSPASGGGFFSRSALGQLPPPPAGEGGGGGCLRRYSVRGRRRSQRFCDHLQNPGAILQNVILPEPQHPPPRLRQFSIADDIGTRQTMLAAIRFDDQARLDAGEIDHIGRDWI